ncbi:zinc-ribbon domain-containing protein [Halobacterium salinarum]|uniref:zinc-ribbon domain-containing protein n=1 Tax=Halobacterium salinarum TaxID=2242 RepID=UPI003D7725F5
MPYCPNCGSQVKAVHHYCGSCGQALSEIAASESDPPMAVDRDGFLSLRSLSYVNELLEGEQELDRDSLLHTALARGERCICGFRSSGNSQRLRSSSALGDWFKHECIE